MAKIHELKTLRGYFQEVLDDNKTFEIRRDDRGFNVGDTLRLREWTFQDENTVDEMGVYTGRELSVEVTYIFVGGFYGIKPGYCVMSIKKIA